MYGKPVDIWSFGAIHFEVVTLEPFVSGQSAQSVADSIHHRLGGEGTESRKKNAGLPLSKFQHMPGASLLDGALKWDPGARMSAEDLRNNAQAMMVSCLSVARDLDSRAPG